MTDLKSMHYALLVEELRRISDYEAKGWISSFDAERLIKAADAIEALAKLTRYAKHDSNCMMVTTLLLSNPPKPAPCSCGFDAIKGTAK